MVVRFSEFLGTIASSFFLTGLLELCQFLCFRIISNVPDINLLYDLSSVVPGEVVTPPCIRGFGIQRFGYYCRVYNINASAGAVIVLGQTAGKSLFSLLQMLEIYNSSYYS